MLIIGNDTLRVYKEFEQEEVNGLILPHLKLIGDKKRLHGIFCSPHKIYPKMFSFSFSPASLTSPTGDNLIPAEPETITAAIVRFKEITGLDIADAEVSRLDVTLMMSTRYPVSAYFPIFHGSKSYRYTEKEHGRYLNNNCNEIALALYDKQEERLHRGRERHSQPGEENLLRLELRILRHVKTYLKLGIYLPKLTVADLSYGYG
ncbi:MAG: hypothetical protein ACHQ6U_13925, partial [Thermodesulfobacteriota bacterium]